MDRQEKDKEYKTECPYCFNEIENKEAGFLINAEGYRFISPVLNEIAAGKTDLPYLYFWSAMGIPEDQIDARRIVIDREGIEALNQELRASGKKEAAVIYDEDSKGYSFYVKEGALSLYSNTMVCPHCHNVLPQNFFKYPVFKIGLAGSIASGKTVYLCSLIMNNYNVMQRENITVKKAGNIWDSSVMEMEEQADKLFRQGICPESTPKIFKKPVFMEISCRIGDKTKHLLLAVYDVAGELLRENAGTGKTGFVRYVDGFICMVDPAQMHLSHAVITNQMPDEELVLRKLHVMSREEQIAVQKQSNENGKQVMDFTEFMASATEGLSDTFLFERNAEAILDNIRSTLGDYGVRQKYMALTLAKSDLLEELGEIKRYGGNALLFRRDQVKYGFLDMNAHLIRQGILGQIFDQKVYRLQKNLEDYKHSSLFAVSALGCETEIVQEGDRHIERTTGEVKPIRVEEPVLWMIMKYMQDRRWLE